MKDSFLKANKKENNAKAQKYMFYMLCTILSVIVTGAFMVHVKANSTSVINYIVFAVSMYLLSQTKDVNDKRSKRLAAVFALPFSLFLSLGNYDVDCQTGVSLLVTVVGFYIFFYSLFIFVFRLFEGKLLVNNKQQSAVTSGKLFLITVFFLLLMWLIYFVAYFPGFTTEDSINQLEQSAGRRPWSNWHPVLHTLIIKLTHSIGISLFKSSPAGVAIYSISQALLMAALIAYFIITLYQFKVKKRAVIFSLLFFSLFPIIPIYSITMWKDIYFAMSVFAFSVTLWRLTEYFEKESKKKLPVFEGTLLFFSAVGICLFRSNGFLAYIVSLPLFIIAYRRRSLKAVGILFFSFVVSVIIKYPIYSMLQIQRADVLESFAVPLQHICSAVNESDSFTDEQYKYITSILPVETIRAVYKPTIVDPVKKAIREYGTTYIIEDNKLQFLKMWLSIGIKHPILYLKGQIYQTRGFWYPDTRYWVYPWVAKNTFGIAQQNVTLSGLQSTLEIVEYIYQFIPILGMFWCIGVYSWVLFISFVISVQKRIKTTMALYAVPLSIILTLILATPVYAEFRYAYSLVLCAPLFCILPFMKKLQSK